MVLAPTRIPSLRSSPWILTHPHRGFSLPRRMTRSVTSASSGGRPGGSPTVGPFPPYELAVPAKKRLGRDHVRRPTVPGERSTRRGEERSVPVAKVRTPDRAPEHLHLVPEDRVLELELRHVSTPGKHPDEADKHEVEEGSQG
jgi:hypothetical protein